MHNYLITIGEIDAPSFSFTNDKIINVSGAFAVDVVGSELSADEVEATVFLEQSDAEIALESANGNVLEAQNGSILIAGVAPDLRVLPYGTPMYVYVDGNLLCKTYTDTITRTGYNQFKIKAMSFIGLLTDKQHLGGLYSGETFEEVAADILGDIPFSCEDEVAQLVVSGWLPIDTARNNLHKLLLAEGVTITKDVTGNVVFSYLYDVVPEDISDDDIYYGGEVVYNTPTTAVEVWEHNYEILPTDEEITLYDNSQEATSADHVFVAFDNAPIHNLTAYGLTINESGYNYAVVSGTGTLTGKVYTHTVNIVRKDSGNALSRENTRVLSEDTLVSFINSENVCERIYAYYTSAKTLKSSIVVDGHQCGRCYRLNDQFGEQTSAYLASMDMSFSGIIKGSCEFIADYTPQGQGNRYNTARILTGNGTFTVPEGVTRVKAVLVGGGNGGTRGSDGTDGERGTTEGNGVGGAGGIGGTGGIGGRIYIAVYDVAEGDEIAYSCGAGGSINGGLGTDSTFNGDSSAMGTRTPTGFLNVINGRVYGAVGKYGVKGGDGATTGTQPAENVIYNSVVYSGGTDGQGFHDSDERAAGGGGGGGAAVGANGANGTDADDDYPWYHDMTAGTGGDGANGADGLDAANYGCGGDGGHGGGGGGGSGGATVGITRPLGGSGGTGGIGGKGGDGCVVIFY